MSSSSFIHLNKEIELLVDYFELFLLVPSGGSRDVDTFQVSSYRINISGAKAPYTVVCNDLIFYLVKVMLFLLCNYNYYYYITFDLIVMCIL